jgi:hypothetical protein
MFTLRTAFTDCNKFRNNFLGNDYELFFKVNEDLEDEFNYYFKELFPTPELNEKECVFAILYNSEKLIPLYKHHKYYIVTEKGKTFGNLSYKDK